MAQLNALIIDDENDIRFLMQILLKSLNFQPLSSGLISQGIELVKSFDFSVVFMDIHLPDGSGLDAIEKIKKASIGNPVIIMISANDGAAERKTAKQRGANFFIGKPLTKEKIIAALVATNLLKR
ncbi:MAG: response regulator [Bacteroidetes bacterium]|nr:response regulator [Bacteroidota bacterium]HET6245669.1 response regulator [Bacteroidia bacterium]